MLRIFKDDFPTALLHCVCTALHCTHTGSYHQSLVRTRQPFVQRWQTTREKRSDICRFFDNLPTAHACARLYSGFSHSIFAQRGHSTNYYAVYPGNTPENQPPAEACMINLKQHGVQNSGPWDLWQASDQKNISLMYPQGL